MVTEEEMKATASPNGVEGEEQLKRRTKQKKKKKTDGDHGEENSNLGTDGKSKKKKSKKRTTSDLESTEEMHVSAAVLFDASFLIDSHTFLEANREVDGEYDVNEPTMEEKLASLGLIDGNKSKPITELEPSPVLAPPSADSVHLLLKQALHADDHALLLDCLYSRDEKVIAKSTSLLNPADVLKLLKSLTSMIQQRGAVLICALPWLRSLLGQHASSIASQESSLLILNSLYQLIDARISTFRPALQLSTCLDVLSAGIPDIEAEEESTEPLVIYEDNDSDEEEDEDAMETDEDLGDIINSPNVSDGSEVMSD